jgi:hypothetical protein
VIARKTWLVVRPLKGLAVFKRNEDEVKKALDNEILNLFNHMDDKAKFDEEYATMAAAVTKLYELRSKERISMDTVVNVVAHLAGLAVVLQHERVHVIASKAFGLLRKIV